MIREEKLVCTQDPEARTYVHCPGKKLIKIIVENATAVHKNTMDEIVWWKVPGIVQGVVIKKNLARRHVDLIIFSLSLSPDSITATSSLYCSFIMKTFFAVFLVTWQSGAKKIFMLLLNECGCSTFFMCDSKKQKKDLMYERKKIKDERVRLWWAIRLKKICLEFQIKPVSRTN